MKNLNLIERLWTDSHEKQKPQRFARYAAMLIMLLTLGVGQMWAGSMTSDGTARLFFNLNAVNWWNANPGGTNGDGNYVYFYGTSGNAWSAHSVQQTGNYYYVVVPNGTWDHVILTRNNTTTSPSWDNKWNKTGDISITDGKNYISAFSEGSATATWSTYQLTSTASLAATSTSITTAQTSTLTPSLTSNTGYNVIKSTSYSVTTNPGSAGSVTSGGVFSATAAGTYTVTATVTYNAIGFASITKTATATKNITVTAASTATLTYHANWYTTETSGSVPAAQTVAVDATATVAGKNTLAMTNYTFSGWNTEEYITGTDYAVGSSITMDEDKDLYAKWTRSITLNQNGATTNGTTSVTGTYNCSTLPSITNPQKTGYTFVGWRTENNGTGNLVINTSGALQSGVYHWTDEVTPSNRFQRYPTSTSPLYATWTQDITLNANISNHGSGTNKTATVTYNSTAVTSITHCTPAAGYKVEGYYTAATDGTKILNADGTFAGSNITVSGDVYIASSQWKHAGATTLYAHYEPKTTVRLYYSNPAGWSMVYAYVWENADGNNKNEAWHGVNITGNTLVRNGDTYYYYEYYKEDHPNWDRVIFNDNGSNQTNNITFSNTTNNGQYNDAGKSEVGSWHDMPAEETVYSVTFYAGNRGAISAKGTAVAKNGNASVNIGATPRALTVTSVDNGYSFDYWETSGSVTVADIYSESTTVSASGTGTVTAHYLANSGWYMHGVIDGTTDWCAASYWPHRWPIDRPYRGVSGVYYRRISSIEKDGYFGIHDGSSKYSGDATGSDFVYDGAFHDLVVNASKCLKAKSAFSNKWVVINTSSSPKKIWIQDAETCHTVSISNDGNGTKGTVVLKTNDHGNLATNQYTNGETIRVEIDTMVHYSIASVYLGATEVTMSHSSGTKFTGTATMPNNDVTLTVTYTPWYQVQLAASPAAAADAPTAAKTTGGASVAHNSYVLSGTSVTFSKDATPNDGYTFDHWDKNGSNVGSGNTYVATISAATTVTAVYTPNKYTITLDNQCAYSNGTHAGGELTSFEVTFGTNYFTHHMTAEPSSYNYDFGGWYTAVGGGGDQIITYLGSLASGATAYTNASGKWNYDGNPTVYAKWSKSYTTGLSEGINANGGSGGAITLTYNSSATSGFTPSTRTGYLLAGYYTASDGGSKVINADGTIVSGDVDGYVDDGKWAYCSSTTFKIYAHWTPITYTIAFDKNDDPSFLNSDIGDDPGNIAATYGVLATMPANPYTRMGYTFNGWATEAHKAKGSVPVTDYDYQAGYSYMNLANTQGATVTLYPKWQGNMYTISFNARGGEVSTTSKEMRYGETYGSNFYDGELPVPYSIPTGKAFIGWFTSPSGGTQVTKDTQLSTVGAHTLYARYSDIATVYFKNTIGWSEVYVTYAAYWDTYADKGTGNNGLTYHKMSLVPGTTDIYKDEIPSAILANWTAGDNSNIAFNSQELLTDKDKHAPTTGDYNNYDKGEVVFRHDFDSRATMFVPRDKNTNDEDGNYKKNSAQYISTGYSGESSNPKYTSGYWMIFNNTYSGYLFSYQKNLSGSWSAEYGMNGAKAGDSVFVYSVKMDANTRYDLRIRKDCQTTNTKSRQFRYGTQITSAACTDLKLVCDPNNNSWMQTTTAGEYKFILTCKKDGHMYLTVEYPLAVNDYQVLYSWNDGSAKTYASEVIKAHPDTVDTISVFVHKLESPVVSRSMKIQKCTGINGSGVPTWTDVTGGGIDLMDVTANGVYNFEITQPKTGDPTGAFAGKYEGDYYIRTACSDGGWDQYKEREDNVMTYSAYSMTQTLSDPYSHYYCRYVGSTSTDITFAVATKYSPNISGTMTGDATIGNAATTLPANANVRFSWNEETNAMARAYIKDAQGPSNARFLVMHGANDDMIFNPDGSDIAAAGSLAANELQFDDKGDWVYQVMLQAKPGAQVSIIAKYGSGEGVDRYLVGGPSSFETIMGGEGSNKYTIMAIYDFKTNRLMNAWTPDGDITDELSDVDMLWIRHRQNSAQQITFNGGSLTNVKAVGAIRLDYNDLVGHVASWTYETRPLLRYFISFPFDVNVSDIFGLHGAELGREFVIRKYDGAERAKNGLFLGDGDTYWIDLTMDSVMHANEGYSLVFDNEYLNGDLGSIWENKTGGSSVYLYFPAAAEIPSISDANKGTILAEHVCEDTRSFDYKGASVSHANSDSHWNLIGSPLFVDSYVYNSSGTNGQAGDKERTTLDSYYAYNVEFNYWEPELYHKGDEYYACKAMHAMLVQFAGSVTWSKNEPNPSLAPSRERKEETVSNLLITLNLLQNGADGDHTYIKLDEDGNSEFMLCEDLFKIDNKKIPNIFSYASGNAVAYNKVAVESQTINLGVDIRKNDTYTFTMPENVAGSIILIDRFDGTRTNLNIENYEIYLNRGSYYDRFAIEINVLDAPTAIDGAADGQGSLKDGKAHKFIMNDMMYIIRDGVLYDAQGKRVK